MARTFGPVCNPLSPRSPRPDIGRALSSSRQRWHVEPAEGPLLFHVTAVRTVLGGTPSLQPPSFCAPSSMKWEPLCPALYITPYVCWAGAGPVGSPAVPGSCAGTGPRGEHTTVAAAAGPSITPGSRSGRSMFGTPLSASLSFRFSLCLANNQQRRRKGVQVNHVSADNTCTLSGRAIEKWTTKG